MLITFYLLIQIIAIACFFTAFFVKHEIFWTLSFIFSAILMVASYNITLIIGNEFMTYSYPYMMNFNLIFFGLSLI